VSSYTENDNTLCGVVVPADEREAEELMINGLKVAVPERVLEVHLAELLPEHIADLLIDGKGLHLVEDRRDRRL
jgi:flagellar biosynthesis component FlhA